MYYVYSLYDPIQKEVFYIGKGKGNRGTQHLNGYDKANKRKCDRIDKIRSFGKEPELHYIVEDIHDEELAYQYEYYMIKHAHKFGVRLTNRVGVDLRPPSRKGAKLTEEQKKAIGDRSRGRKYSPLSEEHKDKISKALKGIEPERALKIDKETLEMLYVKMNKTRKQIASIYGVSLYPINRLLKKYNISKL